MIIYSDIYSFFVQIIISLVSLITDAYPTKKKFNVIIFIFTIIVDIISFFWMCVYCEIFELNFCDFNYNLRRNIIERGEEDVNNMGKMESYFSINIEEKDDENVNEINN